MYQNKKAKVYVLLRLLEKDSILVLFPAFAEIGSYRSLLKSLAISLLHVQIPPHYLDAFLAENPSYLKASHV